MEFPVKRRVDVLKGRLRIWQGQPNATHLGEYRKFLDLSSLDICKVFGGAHQDLIIMYFLNLFGKFGKVPKCPVEPVSQA